MEVCKVEMDVSPIKSLALITGICSDRHLGPLQARGSKHVSQAAGRSDGFVLDVLYFSRPVIGATSTSDETTTRSKDNVRDGLHGLSPTLCLAQVEEHSGRKNGVKHLLRAVEVISERDTAVILIPV